MILSLLTLSLAHATPHMDSIYLVMVDRFANGNPANDNTIDLNDPAAFHGGDLAGLISRLDDIDALPVAGLLFARATYLSGLLVTYEFSVLPLRSLYSTLVLSTRFAMLPLIVSQSDLVAFTACHGSTLGLVVGSPRLVAVATKDHSSESSSFNL